MGLEQREHLESWSQQKLETLTCCGWSWIVINACLQETCRGNTTMTNACFDDLLIVHNMQADACHVLENVFKGLAELSHAQETPRNVEYSIRVRTCTSSNSPKVSTFKAVRLTCLSDAHALPMRRGSASFTEWQTSVSLTGLPGAHSARRFLT